MKHSDIQIVDVELWEQGKQFWNSNRFSSYLDLLKSEQLDKKVLIAKILNNLTDEIVQVEQNDDPGFKSSKIPLSRRQPINQKQGEVWFQWTQPYTFDEVSAFNYTFNDIDTLNIAWDFVDRGEW